MGNKKSKIKYPYILCIIILLIAGICLYEEVDMYNKRILWTKHHLKTYRMLIKQFHEEYHRFPDSIDDLNSYRSHITGGKKFSEYFSCREGCDVGNEMLNGKGGWYYNKNTGEIKINIQKPIKYYLKIYIGKDKTDIPSEW
ncbi:MAG: hypothetical protein KAT56_04050 [Sedimentisphaerales bacterium]|nr:hypothetical protein [Sedimentisphaerales bacterium]